VVTAISRAANTWSVGNGKVLGTDVDDAIRIRAGEHGDSER